MTVEHPMHDGVPPQWASEWGQDRFGVFAAFRVGDVVHRMRWIPSTRFVMGSPPAEQDIVFYDETPHEVRADGYWLGETPVTQALWQEVLGENPARFRSPGRPVENVTWPDCQQMIKRLNARISRLHARLPTEAEWECACRAGAATATYAGDLDTVRKYHAPVLDEIAWYGGNSGVGYDLADGADSSSWQGKQFDHLKAGTREVGWKRPNDHGLFDMLGNVWEWCGDLVGDYPQAPCENPRGPDSGVGRVVRGGSWYTVARYVRAGCRNALGPGNRGDFLGFRLARGRAEQ